MFYKKGYSNLSSSDYTANICRNKIFDTVSAAMRNIKIPLSLSTLRYKHHFAKTTASFGRVQSIPIAILRFNLNISRPSFRLASPLAIIKMGQSQT